MTVQIGNLFLAKSKLKTVATVKKKKSTTNVYNKSP
jgi:hypothetical protein